MFIAIMLMLLYKSNGGHIMSVFSLSIIFILLIATGVLVTLVINRR